MKRKLVFKAKPKIAIVYRGETSSAFNLGKTLTAWLKERGYKVFTAPEQKLIPGSQALKKTGLSKIGLVVVLGGDGTYLRAARIFMGRTVPVMGVNLGSLGFLTPFRADGVFSAIESTLQGKMYLAPRTTFELEIIKKGKKRSTVLALNDIVLERGSFSSLINIGVYHNQQLLSDVKADGIIVSSPTGSTAYNLAAGGPIMHPEMSALVVTPISPHSLTSRPVILPDDGVLSLKLAGKMQGAHLIADGQKLEALTGGDEVVIRQGRFAHYTVHDPDHGYFELLREKLKFGDRA